MNNDIIIYPARGKIVPQPRPGIVMDVTRVRKVPERDYSRRRVSRVVILNTVQEVVLREVPVVEPVVQPSTPQLPPAATNVPVLSDVERQKIIHRTAKHAKKIHHKDRYHRWVHFIVYRAGLFIIAGALVATTIYVGVTTMLTNKQVEAQVPTTSYSHGSAEAPASTTQEGADKTPLPAHSLASYHVAADLPRALYISKLKIAARTIPMSVNKDGSVQAPVNIFDSGWYNGSVKPGEIGAVFIDGHSSGSTHEGLFGNLDKLVVGDTLQLEKGDGSRLTYKVVHTDTVALKDVDMKKMLLPYGNALRGLNMMTCAGQWVTTNGQQTLDKRVLIFTEQI